MTADNVIDHPAQRRHRWSVTRTKTFLPPDTPSGCEETHKFCEHCSIVKVTVHPPSPELPYRAWIAKGGGRWIGDGTPECDGSITPMGVQP